MALIEKRKMNYHQYYPVDTANGPHPLPSFVSGCVHECPGCYNKSTWRLSSGMPFTLEMADRIIADLNDTRACQGTTFSGVATMYPQNVRSGARKRRTCRFPEVTVGGEPVKHPS